MKKLAKVLLSASLISTYLGSQFVTPALAVEVQDDYSTDVVNKLIFIDSKTNNEISKTSFNGNSFDQRLDEYIKSLNSENKTHFELVSKTLMSTSISSSSINGRTTSHTTREYKIVINDPLATEPIVIKPKFVPNGVLYDNSSVTRAMNKISIIYNNRTIYANSYIDTNTIDARIREAMTHINKDMYYYDSVDVSSGFTSIFTSSGSFSGRLNEIEINVKAYSDLIKPTAEVPKTTETPKSVEQPTVEVPKTTETPKPVEQPTVEVPKTTETPKPVEQPTVEVPKTTETPKSVEQPTAEVPKTTETPKPVEQPTVEVPKTTETPKPVEQPTVEVPKTTETPKTVEQPVVVVSKPVISNKYISNKTTKVTGKADANSIVYAKVNGKVISVAKVVNGKFSMNLPKQKEGNKVYFYTKTNKKVSKSVSYTVLDKVAPTKAVVNKVTSKSTYITGKGEKNATVTIYKGTKKIGTAKVISNGTFKAKVTAQKKGTILSIVLTDKAMNSSAPVKIKVS